MSTHPASHPPASSTARLTIRDLQLMKGRGQKIVSLTAYSAPMAALLDPHIDLFIVGDSVGMVLYGLDSTLGVDLEMMIRHGRAVVSHSQHALVLIDLPFGSYQSSPAQAFENASRLLAETRAQAIKLEGGLEMVDTVRFLVERGIPVMAHIGLKPQHVHRLGGYRSQGGDKESRALLVKEAKAFEEAGAFALLLEGIKEPVAKQITTETVHIPTIGIGASPACDGQVLVSEDMLGLMPRAPKFVEQYAALHSDIERAAIRYAEAVRSGEFPHPQQHCYH